MTETAMDVQSFAFPTQIRFGAGARRLVGPHLAQREIARPLVVTDRGLAALSIVAELVAHLEAHGLATAVFGGVFGNPTASQAAAGAEAYHAHRADAVVGIGGGAALDVAKIVGVVATRGGSPLEYAYDHPQVRAIDPHVPYFVALPTTAGTGSEVGRSAVISEDDSKVKRIVFSPHILAKTVFADPELTVGLPPHVTAATGMDALTHNVESWLSPAYHPLCDGIALEGTRIAARSLVTAVREPANLDARADMLMASMMGAIAFQKDLGATHACAHALGTVCDLHHGLANALMIDTVMAWNLEAAPAKFDELAHVVGASGGGEGFVRWLRELKSTLGLGTGGLAAAGVTRAQLPRLVEVALADVCHRTNPRPVAAEDFERLFERAMA